MRPHKYESTVAYSGGDCATDPLVWP